MLYDHETRIQLARERHAALKEEMRNAQLVSAARSRDGRRRSLLADLVRQPRTVWRVART
jgi:hypothetical protein